MESSTYLGSLTRPWFVGDDDCLVDMEAGFSGNPHPVFSQSSSCNNIPTKRSSSYRGFSSFSSTYSPRSGRFFDARSEEHHHPHFLHACFLCKNPLGDNRDIFMYRGDTPFCSEECRQEQIDRDEAKEKNGSLSSSSKGIRKDQQKSSPNKTQNYHVRTGTVAAA